MKTVSQKTNMNGLWMAMPTSISRNWAWQNLLHLMHCTHAHILGMIVHVCMCTRAFVLAFDTLILQWKKTAGGIKLEKKRGGIVEGRRRASLLQWQVYSLGTAAISCFHRVKNFSPVFFFKPHLKQPSIIYSSVWSLIDMSGDARFALNYSPLSRKTI